MTPQSMMEAWLRLMNEAMRGNSDAQDAIRSLTMSPVSPDQMMRWMSRFMPLASGGMSPVKPEVFESWLDEYWKMMGVVPRHRYLELLERHETLRARLEDSEKTVRQLQGMLGMPGQQQEAQQQVISLWGNMMQETMKAQAQWMQAFSGMMKQGEEEPKTPEPQPASDQPDEQPEAVKEPEQKTGNDPSISN